MGDAGRLTRPAHKKSPARSSGRGFSQCHYRTDITLSAHSAEPGQPARVSPRRTLLVVRMIARLLCVRIRKTVAERVPASTMRRRHDEAGTTAPALRGSGRRGPPAGLTAPRWAATLVGVCRHVMLIGR